MRLGEAGNDQYIAGNFTGSSSCGTLAFWTIAIHDRHQFRDREWQIKPLYTATRQLSLVSVSKNARLEHTW